MRVLFLFLSILNLSSSLSMAGAHRAPSVLPGVRSIDDLQVVREDGILFRKELFDDGMRVSTVRSKSSVDTHSWNFSDFAGKKSCNRQEEGRLIIAYSIGAAKKATEACTDLLEGSVSGHDTLGKTLVCKYSCRKITLESLQSLFFESFVLFLEPNAARTLN